MDITIISGITSCYIFEYDGKKYYLFGDYHFTRANNCKELGHKCDYFDKTFTKTYTYGSDCTTIGALLHNWFTYNNKHGILTDFYIELFYTKENERVTHKPYNDIIENRRTNTNNGISESKINNDAPFRDQSWLQLMYYIMKPCFVREKDKCPYYPNVHAHYVDVRNVDVGDIISVNPFELEGRESIEYVKILFLQYKIILRYLLNVDGFGMFLDNAYLLPDTLKDVLVNNVSLFTVTREIDGEWITMYKTAWELYRLEQLYPMIASKLREYVQITANNIINNVYQVLKNEKISYDRYNDLLVDMQSISMDVYTLSRVFIQNDSEQVIIYTGADHIRFYADFFQTIGFQLLTYQPYKKGQNCITMNDLPLYLDANKYR